MNIQTAESDQEAPRVPSKDLEPAKNALKGLSVASRLHRLYGNSKDQQPFQRALGWIRDAIPEGRVLAVSVYLGTFEIDETKITGDDPEELIGFATALYERGVEEIRLRAAPEPEELAAFATLVNTGIHELEEIGGAKAFLDREGVLGIAVGVRNLEVTEAETAAQLERLSDELRQLMGDQEQLAQTLEAEGANAREIFKKLKALMKEGLELGVNRTELEAGIADTVAALSPNTRSGVVRISTESLEEEPLAGAIIAQLSESELAESFFLMKDERGIDGVFSDAAKIVEHTRGRRLELPVIIGRRMIDSGMDRTAVIETLNSIFGAKAFAKTAAPTEGLDLKDATEQVDLEAMQREARQIVPEEEEEAGLATLDALLGVLQKEEDFDSLVKFAADSLGGWIEDSQTKKGLSVLEVLVKQADQTKDPKRKDLLERAIRDAVGPQAIGNLLDQSNEEADHLDHLLGILGPRCAQPLLARLADESDGARRKLLVDKLADVGRHNAGIFVAALEDERWFLVRNLATILVRTHDPEAVPHLIRLCAHEDARVRREALRGVAALAGPKGVAPVTAATDDPDESVRLTAIAELGGIRLKESLKVLSGIASSRSRSLRERKGALTSLQLRGDEEALHRLGKVSRKWWPPTPTTRQLRTHARSLIKRLPTRQR